MCEGEIRYCLAQVLAEMEGTVDVHIWLNKDKRNFLPSTTFDLALKFGAAPGSCKKYRGKYTQLGLDKDDLICNVTLNATSSGGRKVRARCVEDAMNAIRDNEQYHNDSDGDPDSDDES